MSKEIERKFLVKGDFYQKANPYLSIKQAYLSTQPERTVRIRTSASKAFITIKGSPNASGITRYEWEKEIPLNEAEELLKLCAGSVIEKTRYLVPCGKHTFEVDVFHGDNEGLVVAEIELQSEDEQFSRPEWLGKEVTRIAKYNNSMLSEKPFKKW